MKAFEVARFSFALAVVSLVLMSPSVFAGTYYISPTGDDSGGNGTIGNPWQSIIHATNNVPDDGSTIIMEDGTYQTQSLSRSFTNPVTIIAQDPYKVTVQTRSNTSRAFDIESGSNVTFSGMNIYGTGNTSSEYLIYICGPANKITFTNNIIHDNYSNDMVKINSAANNVTFKGNVLYNQAPGGGVELFDINTVQNCTVQGNIMLEDYAASGRTAPLNTQSFIVIKNSGYATSPNYTQNCNVQGNIFENWSGSSDETYVLYGEDGESSWEAQNCKVENNLFLCNDSTPTWGAIMLKGGVTGITVRANTISGNPGGNSPNFGATLQQIGSNVPMQNIDFSNNIWTDQSGNMVGFSNSNSGQVATGNLKQNSNIYWNGGKSIPNPGILNPSNDLKAVMANPGLPDPTGMTVSYWNPTTLSFLSGQTTIGGEFLRVVDQYAALPGGSPAIDAADPTDMPATDILGNTRDSRPDIGCFEYIATPGDADKDGKVGPADLAIVALNWDPSGKTETWWTGDFDGDGAVGPSDLALIGLNWNPSGTTGQVSVPEPASLSLLAIAGLAVLLGFQRSQSCVATSRPRS